MGLADWGDVPTWGAAFFAGGAAWFAYQTIKSQRQQITEQRQFIAEQSANLRLEREELLAVAAERRSAQARRVAASGGYDGVRRTGPGWLVVVTNNSDEPIHEVTIHFGDRVTVRIAEWPGNSSRTGSVPVLGAGKYARFFSNPVREGDVRTWPLTPSITFTDNSSVTWSLDLFGDLSEAGRP